MKTTLMAFAVVAAGMTVAAQDRDPLEYFEARKNVMEFIGGQMRMLGAMAQGRVDFDAVYVQTAGAAMAAMASTVPLLFPPGTENVGKTEARQEIFDFPEDFSDKADALRVAALNMQKSDSLESFQQAFGGLGGSCKSCHSLYRK